MIYAKAVVILDSVGAVAPGESCTVGIGSPCLFRADCAVGVDGVDYDAFDAEMAMVGAMPQFRTARPANELLHRLIRESDATFQRHGRFATCQLGLTISITVRNTSDRPQRFAIKLVGKAVY